MHIPSPHINIRARNLFRQIYNNRQINVEASKQTLKDQSDFYLDHLSTHLKKPINSKDRLRIWDIIKRNDEVASILESSRYKKIVEDKKNLLGNTAVGFIFCIDGRIPTVFLGGRFAKHWEVPAAEIIVSKRKSDGKIIPESSELCEALRNMATGEFDTLEIVFAHTSSIGGHGCGAMAAKKASGEIKNNLSLEEANITIIKNKTIPALTNLYNDFRIQQGLNPLKCIGIAALYDTDTFGIILNYEDKKNILVVADLTNKYKDQMEEVFIKDNLLFGVYSKKFVELKFLTIFSENLLKITKSLINDNKFRNIQKEVTTYINKTCQDLTASQKKALIFFIYHNIAFQYLTGLSSVSKKNLDHAFCEHKEEYMTVSIRGTTIGKFDPELQGFSLTPADAETAIKNIKTKLSIMEKNKSNKNKPYILFVCNPINPKNLRDNSRVLQRAMATNSELLRRIITNKDLGAMIEDKKIIPVPVLINEDTREVLKIIDHSAYI